MTTEQWAPPAERLEQVRAFMAERVLPNEPCWTARMPQADALVEVLRDEVRALGLWAPHLPPEAGGTGTGFLDYAYLNEQIGRCMWGQLVFGCQAPDAGNGEILHLFGTREQKERWLRPLVAGELRSFFSMTEPEVPGLRPDDAPHARGSRRRRLGDRRPQVVLVGRRRRGLRDRDGGHRPRRAAARPRDADHRPGRHARASTSSGRCRCSGTPAAAGRRIARCATRRVRVPGLEHARRGRPGVRDRAEAPRPGPDPPRDALARPDAARLRPDVHVRARAGDVRRAARREADRAELDRRQLRRDPGMPADDARRGAQDRRRRRGAGRDLGDQVLRGARAPRRDRPRGPGARRPRPHRRDAAGAACCCRRAARASTTGRTRCTEWSSPGAS